MEYVVVGALLLGLILYSQFGASSLWVVFLFVLFFILNRSRKLRCGACKRHPIPVKNIPYCNRCGETQPKTNNTRGQMGRFFFGGLALMTGVFASWAFLSRSLWRSTLVGFGPLLLAWIVALFVVPVVSFWITAKFSRVKIQVRCAQCRRLLRNEMRIDFCGHCGATFD